MCANICVNSHKCASESTRYHCHTDSPHSCASRAHSSLLCVHSFTCVPTCVSTQLTGTNMCVNSNHICVNSNHICVNSNHMCVNSNHIFVNSNHAIHACVNMCVNAQLWHTPDTHVNSHVRLTCELTLTHSRVSVDTDISHRGSHVSS